MFPQVVPLPRAGHLRVTHPSATLQTIRISSFSFDLHVLGTPPAFILSQDQTLRCCLLDPILRWGPLALKVGVLSRLPRISWVSLLSRLHLLRSGDWGAFPPPSRETKRRLACRRGMVNYIGNLLLSMNFYPSPSFVSFVLTRWLFFHLIDASIPCPPSPCKTQLRIRGLFHKTN